FAVTDLSLGVNRVERRTGDLVHSEEHADTLQGVPDQARENVLWWLVIGEQLNARVGEAETELAAQILLQARIGYPRSFDLGIGQNQAVVLSPRIRHEAIDDWIQRNLVRVERNVVGVAFHAQVQISIRTHGRAIQRELKRFQQDLVVVDFRAGHEVCDGELAQVKTADLRVEDELLKRQRNRLRFGWRRRGLRRRRRGRLFLRPGFR